MKTVLFAHQSTIPHYRIPFYNCLEQIRPDSWRFDVVFDPQELSQPRFFKEAISLDQFHFPILTTNTHIWRVMGKQVVYQSFWRKALDYDLIIVENALNNLTYPLCHLHQLCGCRLAHWGHGRDWNIVEPIGVKKIAETIKLCLIKRVHGFFAYTQGVKDYLLARGVQSNRIFVVNNTIDILAQHQVFTKILSDRENIRRRMGLTGKKVLLFVGRFTQNKRIDFLLKAFAALARKDPSYHLLLVGGSTIPDSVPEIRNVSVLGSIVATEQLGAIYVASDLCAFPGAIGLAPIQALCYDLPIVTVDLPVHKPEFEYLSPVNSLVLPSSTTPDQYAAAIERLFTEPAQLQRLRQASWASIRHLTIEAMAQNFVHGISTML